jgi:hypothetical protein
MMHCSRQTKSGNTDIVVDNRDRNTGFIVDNIEWNTDFIVDNNEWNIDIKSTTENETAVF